MRILLTGASGYLGMHLSSTLVRAGHEVTALVRSPDRLGRLAEHRAVTVRHADLLEESRVAAAVEGHEVCVHAGFVWGPPRSELELLDTVAAAKLFDAAGRTGVGRTVLVSSTAVHRPFTTEMQEDDALTTADVYGATKAAAELFLWAACGTHAMQGVVLRPGPIVGSPALPDGAFRSDRRIVALVDAARRGEPLRMVRGEGRQFVAAEDVARTVAVAIEAPEASGTYLCVDREFTSWESIARRAVELTQSTSSVVTEDDPEGRSNPRFNDSRLATLLGGPLDSRAAMEQRLAHFKTAVHEFVVTARAALARLVVDHLIDELARRARMAGLSALLLVRRRTATAAALGPRGVRGRWLRRGA